MGYCAGTGAPGFTSAPGRGGARCGFGPGMMGRGMGRGRGRGMGRGLGGAWGYVPANAGQPAPWTTPDNPEMERQYLREQASTMEQALASIKARLNTLDEAAAGQE